MSLPHQELAEDDLEDFKSCISNLAAENTELKEKLKKFESQVEISTDNSDHEKSGKDIREEIRKLKKVYKILKSEDKEISALQAEKNFVWNQLKTMEEDYSGTIKSKNIEVKQATEAAQKLLQNVDELQVEAQKKDDGIVRLQVEVTNAKERMSILEDELQKLHSLVEDKEDLGTGKNEDGQPETSRMSKEDTNKANRKSKSECLALEDISRTSQVTPDRREVKTTRTRASETNQKPAMVRLRPGSTFALLVPSCKRVTRDVTQGFCKLKLLCHTCAPPVKFHCSKAEDPNCFLKG